MVPGLTRPRHAFAHFCCYLSQTVRVTLKFSRRNGRSRKKIHKKRNSFGTFVLPDHPWPPGDPPPQGTLPETPLETPQTPPETSPGDSQSLPETLMAENYRKFDENWFEWGRHESPRAHIRRGRSYGLSDASGTLPDPFSARFRSI